MAKRIGNHTIEIETKPVIKGYGAVVGKKEAEGPLGTYFDVAYSDEFCGEKTFEKAETHMQKTAIKTAIRKAGLNKIQIDCAFAGDLLNQCIGSSFGMRDLRLPFCGLYGACSTMALSIVLSSILIDCSAAENVVAAASSHFCSAERQYRYPLEYGGQRSQAAQWTVTGAGACIVGASKEQPHHRNNNMQYPDNNINQATSIQAVPRQTASATAPPAANTEAKTVDQTSRKHTADPESHTVADLPKAQIGYETAYKHIATPPRKKSNRSIFIEKVIIGSVRDLKIKDPNNMGAAMAPAAAQTISQFLRDTNTTPRDYDMILTGDLGSTGSALLTELLKEENNIDISPVHNDCGVMIFDAERQDVHSGGSGCGCSAAVVCSYIFDKMQSGELNNALFVGTGALLSPTSSLQKESIPGIAHGVLFKGE